MGKYGRILLVLAFCFTAAGCLGLSSKSEQDLNAQTDPPAAQNTSNPAGGGTVHNSDGIAATTPKPVESAPPDGPTMDDEVRIVLDAEPSIHSPIQTLVSTHPQKYTMTFKNNVNRKSVEDTLNKQTILYAYDPAQVQISFDWENDRKLHLTVTASEIKQGQGYQLDVMGALKADDTIMESPPVFSAVITEPKQIWRISADGQTKEKLSNFSKPYFFQKLSGSARYVLATRYVEYCECDGDLRKLFTVYDLENKQEVPYPNELQLNYQGSGDFIADTRGFFYEKPAADIIVPESATAHHIQIDGFVHGAAFNTDSQYLIMAVGGESQVEDLDLVIFNLSTDSIASRLNQGLNGKLEENQINGANIPVEFKDLGKQLYIQMADKADMFKRKILMYSWDTGKIAESKPEADINHLYDFSVSTDGIYTVYGSSGLYKGDKNIADYDTAPSGGTWLHGTHVYVYAGFNTELPDDVLNRKMLMKLDADQLVATPLVDKLPVESNLLGSSADGKWVYWAE